MKKKLETKDITSISLLNRSLSQRTNLSITDVSKVTSKMSEILCEIQSDYRLALELKKPWKSLSPIGVTIQMIRNGIRIKKNRAKKKRKS